MATGSYKDTMQLMKEDLAVAGISLNVLADNQGCAAVVEESWAYD